MLAACCWSLDTLCVPSLDPSEMFPCSRVFPHWGFNKPFLCIASLCVFQIQFWEPNIHLPGPNSHSCCCLWAYVNPVPQFVFLRQGSSNSLQLQSPTSLPMCSSFFCLMSRTNLIAVRNTEGRAVFAAPVLHSRGQEQICGGRILAFSSVLHNVLTEWCKREALLLHGPNHHHNWTRRFYWHQ